MAHAAFEEGELSFQNPDELAGEGIGRCGHWHLLAAREGDADQIEGEVRMGGDVPPDVSGIGVGPDGLVGDLEQPPLGHLRTRH